VNSKAFISILLVVLHLSCASVDKTNPSSDINLIVPGNAAEGFIIGETFENTNSDLYTIKDGNLKDITGVEYFTKFQFDSIFRKKESTVLFIKNKTIIAITGMKTERRITDDAVLLSKGVDNLILSYGNSGLSVITRNKHRLYIYKESGLALFDDNSDDTIDMFLVFKD